MEALRASAQPVPSAPRGLGDRLKRWVRRAIAKAATRGARELQADQRAFNQAAVTAIGRLAASVQALEGDRRMAMRDPSTPVGLQEGLRALRADVQAIQARPGVAGPTGGEEGAEGEGLARVYHAFEEAFRGSQALVESRLQVYLPWVQKGLAGVSDPVWLDLGCGRGEWLRLLKKEGIRALGVDSNEGQAEAARAAGLDVVSGDLMRFVRQRPAGTADGFSAFHVVEHLPPPLVLELLQEGLRIVRPGGVLILETPNPENLQVGAHTFYLDPTHRNPVPSGLLSFLVQQAGWEQVEVVPLHPDEVDLKRAREAWKGNPTLLRLADLVFGPRDYAVVARRPMAG